MCETKGGKEETWLLPKDVKEAVDGYLKVDSPSIMRYDHARENLDNSPVKTLSWDGD